MQKPKLDPLRLTSEQKTQLEQYEHNKSQLQTLNDLTDIAQEILFNLDDNKKDAEEVKKNFGAILMDIRESIAKVSGKETVIDQKPVTEALRSLESCITANFKSLEQPNPEIKVEAPIVNVEKTDISKDVEKLVKSLQKSTKDVIASIPSVEVPEYPIQPLLESLEGISEQLLSIETATRMKVQAPSSMIVTNPDGSVIGSASEGNYATIVDDYTTANVTYVGNAAIGSATTDAVWQVKKVDGTTGTIVGWADSDDLFDNEWGTTATSGDVAGLTFG